MATITLTYDARNSMARRIVAKLKALNVFKVSDTCVPKEDSHNEEKEAFILTSRHNAAKIFADKI